MSNSFFPVLKLDFGDKENQTMELKALFNTLTYTTFAFNTNNIF